MLTLGNQVRRRAHKYLAHGGKKNRRQQVDRMEIVVNWIQTQFCLTGLDQVGKRHVIAYWKNHRKIADTTAIAYWRAIKVLWGWLGRSADPPIPRPSNASGPEVPQ